MLFSRLLCLGGSLVLTLAIPLAERQGCSNPAVHGRCNSHAQISADIVQRHDKNARAITEPSRTTAILTARNVKTTSSSMTSKKTSTPTTTMKSTTTSSSTHSTTTTMPCVNGSTYTITPTASSTALRRYIMNCGYDYTGGDMQMVYAASFQECINQCDSSKGCVDLSWVSANGFCYMKNVTVPMTTASAVLVARLSVSSTTTSSTKTSTKSTTTTSTTPSSSSITSTTPKSSASSTSTSSSITTKSSSVTTTTSSTTQKSSSSLTSSSSSVSSSTTSTSTTSTSTSSSSISSTSTSSTSTTSTSTTSTSTTSTSTTSTSTTTTSSSSTTSSITSSTTSSSSSSNSSSSSSSTPTSATSPTSTSSTTTPTSTTSSSSSMTSSVSSSSTTVSSSASSTSTSTSSPSSAPSTSTTTTSAISSTSTLPAVTPGILPAAANWQALNGVAWNVTKLGTLGFNGALASMSVSGDKCRTGSIGGRVIWNCGDMMCAPDWTKCGFSMGPGFYGTNSLMTIDTGGLTNIGNDIFMPPWSGDAQPSGNQTAFGMDMTNVVAVNNTHGVVFAWEIWRGASDGSIVNRGNAVASVTLSSKFPIATRQGPLLTDATAIQLGLLAAMVDGGYIYLYSLPQAAGIITVTRVPASDAVFDITQYQTLTTAGQWVQGIPTPAQAIASYGMVTAQPGGFGCAVYGSVFYNAYLKKYMMICNIYENWTNMYASDTPTGPWSAEYGILAGVTGYGSMAHPEYSPDGGKTIPWSQGPNAEFDVFSISFA